MKKIVLLLMLMVLPIAVNAASINVKSLDATLESNVVKYSGEMEDGSFAVMCKLINSKDEEVDYLSSEVDKAKFEGEFNVTKEDTYKVSCANYEGGEIKTVDVKVSETKKEETPNTFDSIMLYVILLVASVVGLSLIVIFKKKAK